ncbi:cysteine-rich secretory family protein [Rarobacter incanus]|uniref:Cysteine-rich secretory family protein n=1 Tax=Rarobacter incanus TaxID=153494 RepID=A0A542SMZ3_9MICO|nr:cysteine-rich secretory family protein [Rarobacter incanus]
MILAAAIVAASLAAPQAVAQDAQGVTEGGLSVTGQSVITARFVDENGWPVPGIEATLFDREIAADSLWGDNLDSVQRTAITDKNGRFTFQVAVIASADPGAWYSNLNTVSLVYWDTSAVFDDLPATEEITVQAGKNQDLGTYRLRSTAKRGRAASSIKTSSKKKVKKAYRKRYAAQVRAEKMPKVMGCRVAATSAGTRKRTLSAVNFMRAMAGVGSVTFTKKLNSAASQAARVQFSNGYLSHFPIDKRCKSSLGATASSSSNLSMGAIGAANIAQYMDDFGENNYAVGHRRWILDPQQKTMGVGFAGSYGALYVMAPGSENNTTPATIAWPTPGYFPVELEPDGRWSFHYTRSDLDFSKATVKVSAVGKAKRARIIYRSGSTYGTGGTSILGHTWGLSFTVPKSIRRVKGRATTSVKVTVSGVSVRGAYKIAPVTYTVKLFKAGK